MDKVSIQHLKSSLNFLKIQSSDPDLYGILYCAWADTHVAASLYTLKKISSSRMQIAQQGFLGKTNRAITSAVRNTSCNRGWLQVFTHIVCGTFTVTSFILILLIALQIFPKRSPMVAGLRCYVSSCRVICHEAPYYELYEDDVILAVMEAETQCQNVFLSLIQPAFTNETMPQNWLARMRSNVFEVSIIGGNLRHIPQNAFSSYYARHIKLLLLENITISSWTQHMLLGLASLESIFIKSCNLLYVQENALMPISQLTRSRSIRSTNSCAPSYISALQPTEEQLCDWRLKHLNDTTPRKLHMAAETKRTKVPEPKWQKPCLSVRPSAALLRDYQCQKADELNKDQLAILKKAFEAFDHEKKGCIGTVMVGTIFGMLGLGVTDETLKEIIEEVDEDGSGELEFDEFVTLAAKFMVEEDAEAMQQELKEAFRLYDKEGNGYITTGVLREILRELDDKISAEELDMMIEEIDSDGSGTVDFDVLKNAFDAFDHEKKGVISTDMIGTILEMLGHELDDDTLKEIIAEVDEDGSGEMEFSEFCTLAAKFLTEEEPDDEAMVNELREAFRLYDKEGNGYITTDVLKEIFRELDNTITADDLDTMIDEIDSDGSGTVDFEEFLEVMTGE
ncbi:hypothetical protein MSG28_003271 [Choristoneura fumiferana]|uniref:Uncharacterized protein n=1 Tax=Choristoneura fumiferana TaxID=7141 RepID=A0ACC0KEV3_CHOFU|nr:hypothetical protein MSG28_003271 [Choristoneura fumiferana]